MRPPSLFFLSLFLSSTLAEATHVYRVSRGCGQRTYVSARTVGARYRCVYPTAVAAAADWNGKEKSSVESIPTAAYPPAVDTITFRVWRTHSVLLTARGHMVRSRQQTVSPRVVHAREPRDGEVQREDKPAEEVEG